VARTAKAPAPPVKGTQALVDVKQVQESCILRRDGSAVAVVEVDGIGFDLLHPTEQDVLLAAYQAALHVLTFPVQIVLMPEPIDLSAEADRFATPVGDPVLDVIGQQFADLIRGYAHALERVTYLLVIPGSSIPAARERGQTVIQALAAVHPDLRPGWVATDRLVSLLARAHGVPLPGPLSAYLPLVDRVWGTAPAPDTKGA
jgi:hypothetical protein